MHRDRSGRIGIDKIAAVGFPVGPGHKYVGSLLAVQLEINPGFGIKKK